MGQRRLVREILIVYPTYADTFGAPLPIGDVREPSHLLESKKVKRIFHTVKEVLEGRKVLAMEIPLHSYEFMNSFASPICSAGLLRAVSGG